MYNGPRKSVQIWEEEDGLLLRVWGWEPESAEGSAAKSAMETGTLQLHESLEREFCKLTNDENVLFPALLDTAGNDNRNHHRNEREGWGHEN